MFYDAFCYILINISSNSMGFTDKSSLYVLRLPILSLHSLRTRELRSQLSRLFSIIYFCALSTQRIPFTGMDGEITLSFSGLMVGNTSSCRSWMLREIILRYWLIDGVRILNSPNTAHYQSCSAKLLTLYSQCPQRPTYQLLVHCLCCNRLVHFPRRSIQLASGHFYSCLLWWNGYSSCIRSYHWLKWR